MKKMKRTGSKTKYSLQMKSKINFENSIPQRLDGVPCSGGTMINMHVFLPLKMTVLIKLTAKSQVRRGEGRAL